MIDDINRNIIDRIVVERSKQLDSAIFGEIQQIAIEYGIETRITMNEKAIADALKKQIPYKPKEYEDKYYACNCGNILLMKWKKYPTELTPKSKGLPYCLACGQKLDWNTNDNTCVCCGEIIPEGRQICPKCERG